MDLPMTNTGMLSSIVETQTEGIKVVGPEGLEPSTK